MRIPSIPHSYREPRIISVFILGIASGLPWVMIGSVLSLWLKESGISRTEIGYSGLIFTVYAVNFIWAPLIDKFKPFSSMPHLGKRQAWIFPCLCVITLLCFTMQSLDPSHSAKTVVLICLAIALCSATQDMAIDAYRIDSFSNEEQNKLPRAAAAATAGWWTGYASLGFIPLYLSDQNWSWPDIYLLLGGFSGVLAAITLALPKPLHEYDKNNSDNRVDIRIANRLGGLTMSAKYAMSLLVFSPLILAIWVTCGSYGFPRSLSQHAAYIPLCIFLGILLAGLSIYTLTRILNSPVKINTPPKTGLNETLLIRLVTGLCSPIQDFFMRNGVKLAVHILLFIFLFKIGEAFLGRMSLVFYKEIGYSNTDIATYSKMLTWWVTVFSAIAAGVFNARLGLIKSLFISGGAMAASNLMFSWIALIGPSIPLYIATVIVDGFATSWSLVSFVAFISVLCNHRFSASQYALFASLGALGRTTLSSLSGQLVDWMNGNWALFFAITALMVLPSMYLLLKLAKQVNEKYLNGGPE